MHCIKDVYRRQYADMNTNVYNTQGQLVNKSHIQEFADEIRATLPYHTKYTTVSNYTDFKEISYPCCNPLRTDFVSAATTYIQYYNPDNIMCQRNYRPYTSKSPY